MASLPNPMLAIVDPCRLLTSSAFCIHRLTPFICSTSKELTEADGFVFGFPTRFGMMAAQMKSFFDTTGQLWQAGALHGKPASMFTSTASQGGGQETTIMTAGEWVGCNRECMQG